MRQTHEEVKAYLDKFYEQICEKHWYTEITKVIYVSDGCAGQFKNRYNLLNLTYHKHDCKLKAEWHFFATSHGKGPCDAIGAVFKKTADSITNFDQVTDCNTRIFSSLVAEQLNKTEVLYVTVEHIKTMRLLRRARQQTIVSTTSKQFIMQRSHFFEPAINHVGTIKVLSVSFDVQILTGVHCRTFDRESKTAYLVARESATPNDNAILKHKKKMMKSKPAPESPDDTEPTTASAPQNKEYSVNNLVAAVYDGEWLVGQILEVAADEYSVQFLKWVGDSGHGQFCFCTAPEALNEQCYLCEILCILESPIPSSSSRPEIMKVPQVDLDKVVEYFNNYMEQQQDNI